jgi:single-strand DNA-binding protein
MTVNKVILVGNLGRDPEVRTSQGGMTIASLNIATTERRKDKEGNWGEHTEWHKVSLFGRTADNAAKFLKKGRQVYVEGRLQTRKWQDKEGHDRYTTEVVADDLRFLGGGEGGGGGQRDRGASGGGYSGGGGGGYSGGGGSAQDDADDIPF